jgi:hypothetical protein
MTKIKLSVGASTKLDVLSPRSEIYIPSSKLLSPRLGTLKEKKIGLLNNTKIGAKVFQPYLEKALKEAIPTAKFRVWEIPFNRYPSKERDLKDLAKWSNAVIGFIGD